MEILSEIKRIKQLMSLNETYFLNESSLPSLAVSTALKSSWKAINLLGNAAQIERTLLSSISDIEKNALKLFYKTSFGVDDAAVNALDMTKILDDIVQLPAGNWTDDIIKSIVKVYDKIPEVSSDLTTTLSKSQDIIDNFKILQKLMDEGSTTYDNILSELSDEIGSNNAKNLLNKVKLKPGVVNTATKITLELSQVIKNVIDSQAVPLEILNLTKNRPGFINECISIALKSGEQIDFDKFVEILNDAYAKLPENTAINKNKFIELAKSIFLKEKEKPLSWGNLSIMKPAAIYLPIVGLIAAYTSDENEQLYFDKCFSEKGYSDEEYDLGNDNKLPSDRQTQFDSDVADCNNTAWSEEIVEDSLDFLQLSLPGLGSLIVYAIKGYKPTQKKPKKRGVSSNEKVLTIDELKTLLLTYLKKTFPNDNYGTADLKYMTSAGDNIVDYEDSDKIHTKYLYTPSTKTWTKTN